jgi:uncharacterized protein YjbI with pentapeptide repeats
MTQIKIKDGQVLFECEGSLREVVELAVRNRIPLDEANLMGADLRGASLGSSSLKRANLRHALLGAADLEGADLSFADLEGAGLRGASIAGTNLEGANLSRADLGNSNLRGASLKGADLRGADLRQADILCADFEGVLGNPYSICHKVEIKFPNLIVIDGEAHTIDYWDKVGLRGYDLYTVAMYESYKSFILRVCPKTPMIGPSRFSRI